MDTQIGKYYFNSQRTSFLFYRIQFSVIYCFTVLDLELDYI